MNYLVCFVFSCFCKLYIANMATGLGANTHHLQVHCGFIAIPQGRVPMYSGDGKRVLFLGGGVKKRTEFFFSHFYHCFFSIGVWF